MRKILNGLLLLLAFGGFATAEETQSEVTAEKARAAEFNEQPQVSAKDKAAARESLNPGVPSAVLAQDIRRSAVGNRVMDEIELGRTEITGNQELPKVLYIVPWQKSDPGDLTGKPVNTLLDEVLAPIDRSEFIRQVEYYGDLYGTEQD
jgi:hypothetical protein